MRTVEKSLHKLHISISFHLFNKSLTRTDHTNTHLDIWTQQMAEQHWTRKSSLTVWDALTDVFSSVWMTAASCLMTCEQVASQRQGESDSAWTSPQYHALSGTFWTFAQGDWTQIHIYLLLSSNCNLAMRKIWFALNAPWDIFNLSHIII